MSSLSIRIKRAWENACGGVFLILFLQFASTLQSAPNHVLQDNGVLIVDFSNGGGETRASEMAVWPPEGIAARPLLIAAHGNGGSGSKEIKGWLALAKKYNFTVICPTFLSSDHSMFVPMDRTYFKGCLAWIQKNVLFDSKNAYMTGFSGGGYAVWYQGTAYPDFFKGLFLQSGNFVGLEYDLELKPWLRKPIHVLWGSKDTQNVLSQHKELQLVAKQVGLEKISYEIDPAGTHKPNREKVVAWVLQELGKAP